MMLRVSAFRHVRILDLSSGIAGPLASMLLADFGADVIKIEGPSGDPLAAAPAAYQALSRNKRRLTLDLATRAGRARAFELCATADVVLADHAPGALEALGLDAERALAREPRLIHAWMPPYDPDPRYADLPASELLLAGLSGTALSQFSWEDVPVHLVTPQLAYAHGLLGAVGIAAALYERSASGLGQTLVVSGLDAVALTRAGAAGEPGARERRVPRGARGSNPSYRLYRCGDGQWLFLGTLLLHHYRTALDVLGLEGLLALPGVDGELARLRVAPAIREVHARTEARFAEHPRARWVARLHAAGVPCAPADGRATWFASEVIRDLEMRVDLRGEDGAHYAAPGVPVRLSETPGTVRHALESLGAEAAWHGEPWRTRPRRSAVTGASRGSDAHGPGGPLAGVRVLDLGAIIAAPLAAALLGSLGAEVVKVEPLGGEGFRASGRAFIGYNQGKRGIALDLATETGRRLLYDLVKRSDVVCDNYRAGVLERLRIDYASLCAIHPGIVQASITGYGSRGVRAAQPGFDPLLQAESGLMQMQGGADEPVFHQIPINDVASAAVAAFGIVAALCERRVTGRGQRVETSLASQSVLTQLGEMACRDGAPPEVPSGARDCPGLRALERFYACRDGWLAIDVRSPAHVHALLDVLGPAREGPAREDDGAPSALRAFTQLAPEVALRAPRDGELAAALCAAFAGRACAETVAALRRAGVPAAPVYAFLELLAEPGHVRADYFRQYTHPVFGDVLGMRRYMAFGRTPSEVMGRAPLLGEHAAELLAALGVDAAAHAELERAGITRTSESPAAEAAAAAAGAGVARAPHV
jgi:crotonobetainyl-CoA:carnitine CoA-transferase CaiB-like acyl-CoA transferase